MSKGVKTVLGVAAAVAVPFVAPAIAGALSLGALGSAVIGAGLGAGAGAFTGGGKGALLGALGGGLGGFAGGGGLSGMFGGAGGATGGMFGGAPVATPTGVVGGLGARAVPTFGAAAPTMGLATGSLGGFASQLAGGVSVPGLANLAMTMFNKPPEGLTPAEQAALMDAANLAQTNQDLFRQRVSEAQRLTNMGTPNPEQAFADVTGRVDRGFREAERTAALRGASTPENRLVGQRQATLAGTREGALAVNRDYATKSAVRQSGIASMPTDMPAGPAYAGLMYAGLPEKRQQTYQSEMSKAVGGLFGTTPQAPMSLKSLF